MTEVLGEKVEPGDARDLPGAVSRVFGDLRGRLDGDTLALCYGSDETVWAVEEGGVLRSWDAATGRQIDAISLSEAESCWAFSPDGRLLASGSNGITIWDVGTGDVLARLTEPAWLLTIAFSPDGKTIASGHDDQTVRLWNSETGKCLHVLKGHNDEVCCLSFSADGKRLASAGEDRQVLLWDVASGQALRAIAGHTDRVDALAWNAKGDRIASAGWDTSVRVWNAKTGDLLAMLNGQGECVHSVVFTPDGRRLACGDSECVVRVWDYEKLKTVYEMRRHHGAVKYLALRADGKRLVSGGADRSIQFWDLTSGQPVFDNQGPLTQVNAVCPSPSDELAALHTGGQISLWSLSTGRPRPVPKHPAPVMSIACNPSGRWALGLANGDLLLTGPGTEPDLKWQAHQSETRLLSFSGDGAEIASCASDGMVRLWDAATGEPILFIPDATNKCSVEWLACHPTKPIVAACGIQWLSAKETDGCITLWNWKTRKLLTTIEGGASRIVFSADGSLLAAVSLYETVMIYDAAKGKLVRELAGRDYATNAIAFDRKGDLFASGSDDCGLRIWDAKSFSMLAAFDLETRIKDVAFTPDGAGVVTGNGSSTCFLVDLEGLSSPH